MLFQIKAISSFPTTTYPHEMFDSPLYQKQNNPLSILHVMLPVVYNIGPVSFDVLFKLPLTLLKAEFVN